MTKASKQSESSGDFMFGFFIINFIVLVGAIFFVGTPSSFRFKLPLSQAQDYMSVDGIGSSDLSESFGLDREEVELPVAGNLTDMTTYNKHGYPPVSRKSKYWGHQNELLK